jgi:hypothetical protein
MEPAMATAAREVHEAQDRARARRSSVPVEAVVAPSVGRRVCIGTLPAPEDPELCEQFIRGQRAALAPIGLARLAGDSSPSWRGDPLCHLAIAHVEGASEPVAGARIHVRMPRNRLVLEDIFATLNPKVSQAIATRSAQCRVAELSNLWVSPAEASVLLAHSMIVAAVALCVRLDAKAVVAFASPQIQRSMRGFGFEVDESVGESGVFAYPDDRFRSSVMWAYPLSVDRMSPKKALLVDRWNRGR